MRPNWISYLLFSALAVTLTAVGCDSTAKGAIPDMSDAALEIVTNATFKSDAPAPAPQPAPGTSSQHSCPCGANCQCENCDGNCLGELVVLTEGPKLEAFAGQTLPLLLAANVTAKAPNSANCTNGQCELTPKCSGGECTKRSGGSGSSCSSGSCGSGSSCSSAFMQGGPVRRVIDRVRPVRRVAGFVNRVRPVRRLAGRLFGGCCR